MLKLAGPFPNAGIHSFHHVASHLIKSVDLCFKFLFSVCFQTLSVVRVAVVNTSYEMTP
jgi:hypothetical protein